MDWRLVDDPLLGPQQALVRVKACGVNRADIAQKQGNYPPPSGASRILGLELAGEIVALPDHAPAHLYEGQAVAALVPGGAYATMAAVDVSLLHPIPQNWSWPYAAAIPEALYTAYLNLFWEARLQAGESVLVHAAAGGIGSMAVQMAALHGAKVIATAGTPEKLEFVRALGADLALNYKEDDLKKSIRHFAPEGVHVVFDTVGGENYAALHPSVMAAYGRWVLIGLLGGRMARLDLGKILVRNLRLIGSTLRSRPLAVKRKLAREIGATWWPRLESGALRMHIDRVIFAPKAEEAHRQMMENRSTGKLVLEMP